MRQRAMRACRPQLDLSRWRLRNVTSVRILVRRGRLDDGAHAIRNSVERHSSRMRSSRRRYFRSV